MAATGGGSSSLSVPELQRQLAGLAEELRVSKEAEGFALQREAAIAEILSVINDPDANLTRVFDVLVEKATQLCSASYGHIWLYDGERARAVAAFAQKQFGDWLRDRESAPSEVTPLGQVLVQHRLVHVVDATAHEGYQKHAGFRELVDRGSIRTLLHVPLRKGGKLLGVITVYRQECRPFSDRQITLLESFAAQAVIAMENARLLTEQREALEQQTATAQVLQVINASPGDLAPVFDAMLDKAMTLCGAAFGFLTSYDGQRFTPVAMRGVPPSLARYFTQGMDQPSPGEAHFRILQGEDVIHNLDQKEEEAYRSGLPLRRAVVDLGGARSALVVALRKDGAVLGALTIYRKEVRPFSEKQIALMRNFAAQAVIAMENARLLEETQEALERQTATTEVLETINSSPGDLQPVFEAILEKAMMLCDAAFGTFATFDGHRLDTVATRGVPEAFARYRLSNPPAYGPGTGPARLIAGEDYVHDIDAADSEAYRQGDPSRRAIVELGGARTILNVALRKDDVLVGTISIYRREVRPFSDNQIALLKGFATQAVIAMENARLLRELRERTDDLTESLEYQTATSELLEVISRSTSDVQPVLDTMLASAGRLCETSSGGVAIRQGDVFRYVASMGVSPELDGMIRSHVYRIDRSSAIGRVALSRSIAHIADAQADPTYSTPSTDAGGIRTLMGVPLLRESEVVGVIVLVRDRVDPFSERQIALIKTFADQ
jgi:GAF domain-containing protein